MYAYTTRLLFLSFPSHLARFFALHSALAEREAALLSKVQAEVKLSVEALTAKTSGAGSMPSLQFVVDEDVESKLSQIGAILHQR